jgi:hypothetical protein
MRISSAVFAEANGREFSFQPGAGSRPEVSFRLPCGADTAAGLHAEHVA